MLALIFGGQELIEMTTAWLDLALTPHNEEMMYRAIVFGTAVYVMVMAVPFVPGAEIGFALLTTTGGALAPLVYLATTASLIIAYSIGRLLPPEILQKGLAAVGLKRAAAFVQEASEMTDDTLQKQLMSMSGPKSLQVLLRYRYVAIALAINMPGNIVLGGGGGLAMMAGLSRCFQPLPFLLTVLVAVLPVPLLFYVGSL